MRFTLVSAADAQYFDLLRGLVLSCRERPEGREVPISILDLGLLPEQRAWLESRGAALITPGWDFDFPGMADAPHTFRAQTARPWIPTYFPGYDVYLWMDADTWIQDWGAIRLYTAIAATGQIAITPEVDRAYSVVYDTPAAWGRYRSWQSVLGDEVAERIGFSPTINSGVFALRADAPHWGLWRERLRAALQRTTSFYIEQMALNMAIYLDAAPAYFLPARCNWICCYALPALRASGDLVEPGAPFDRLSILHLTRDVKSSVVEVPTSEGTIRRTLEFRPAESAVLV